MEHAPKLGILGGMGPQATIAFYQRIVNATLAVRDQDHIQTLILCDTQMPDRTEAILANETEETLHRLIQDAKQLEENGCTLIAIPCNTAHYFVPQMQAEVGIPILHMIDEAADYLMRQGRRRPGIMATVGTLQTELYQMACRAQGMTPCIPDEAGQQALMSLIYGQIKAGLPGRRENFLSADRYLREMGCDCIILGCTEMSVYGAQAGLDDFYVDPMTILAQRAVVACGKPLRPDAGRAL